MKILMLLMMMMIVSLIRRIKTVISVGFLYTTRIFDRANEPIR